MKNAPPRKINTPQVEKLYIIRLIDGEVDVLTEAEVHDTLIPLHEHAQHLLPIANDTWNEDLQSLDILDMADPDLEEVSFRAKQLGKPAQYIN